jgi:hypothetical protein
MIGVKVRGDDRLARAIAWEFLVWTAVWHRGVQEGTNEDGERALHVFQG